MTRPDVLAPEPEPDADADIDTAAGAGDAGSSDATLMTGPTDPSGDRRSARRLVVALLVAGVCVDLVVRSRLNSIAGTAAFLALAAVLVVSGRVVNAHARVLVLLAPALSVFLSVRASPWLVPLNAASALGVLLVGAVVAGRDDVFDVAIERLGARLMRVVVALVFAPAVLADRVVAAAPVPGEAFRDQLRALARGLGLAVPVLGVLGLLLASADAVFASFFVVPIDPTSLLGHVLAVLVGAWLGCALIWLAVDDSDGPDGGVSPLPTDRPMGGTEAGVVLGALVALYGLFVVAQVVASGAGESYIVATTGLTRAEYARSGFFQLLWAAGITLAVLLVVHRLTDSTPVLRRRMGALYGAAVVLTLGVVLVAIQRLGLYADAFGLTMLRLYSTVFAWWLGGVLVVVGVYLVVPWRRMWWPGAVVVSAVAVVVALNVVNPEQVVVEYNFDHLSRGGELDVGYLLSLSDDGIPALLAGIDDMPAEMAERVIANLCGAPTGGASPWFGHNWSIARADAARDQFCSLGRVSRLVVWSNE